MKTKKTSVKEISYLSVSEALKNSDSIANQNIKGEFVANHVYCNVGSLVEYSMSKGFEDSDAPVNMDSIENYYSYPEWSTKLLGESLSFEGGNESAKDDFSENFDRLTEESETLLENGEISIETHERNLELIEEAKEEFNDIETEPSEIFEWWAVSSFLYDKLNEMGYCVCDTGSCKVWGRTTTGQAILLDYVISRICAEMQILEGQENSWAK